MGRAWEAQGLTRCFPARSGVRRFNLSTKTCLLLHILLVRFLAIVRLDRRNEAIFAIVGTGVSGAEISHPPASLAHGGTLNRPWAAPPNIGYPCRARRALELGHAGIV